MENYFEEKTSYNQISFRYAKGKSLKTGNEIHPFHEILFYIDGKATFLSENFKEELTEGTLLIIPKEMYHKFLIKNEKNYTRFVINFPDFEIIKPLLPQAMSEIKIIKEININLRNILNRMCDIISKEKSESAKVNLYGSFLSLISEICIDTKSAVTPKSREKELLISKCIGYIDNNYTLPICVDDIAQEMFVSAATLFQCFKNELGISLHKYITEKRMIYARNRILNGENPTNIYTHCGYNDYSSFYKAYVKMFSHSPSKDKDLQ